MLVYAGFKSSYFLLNISNTNDALFVEEPNQPLLIQLPAFLLKVILAAVTCLLLIYA